MTKQKTKKNKESSPWDARRDRQILNLRRKGYTLMEIGEKLNPPVSHQRIQAICSRYKDEGYDITPIPRKHKQTVQALELEKKVLKTYARHENFTIREIAEKCKVSYSSVRRIFLRHGLALRSPHSYPMQKISLSQREEIRENFKRGVSVKEIAKQYGCTVGRIYQIVNRYVRKRRVSKKQHEAI